MAGRKRNDAGSIADWGDKAKAKPMGDRIPPGVKVVPNRKPGPKPKWRHTPRLEK